jgi:hypothetical protein
MLNKNNSRLLLQIIGFCYRIYDGEYKSKEDFENACVEALTPLKKALED